MNTLQSELEKLNLNKQTQFENGTKHKRIMKQYNEYIKRRKNRFKDLSRFRIHIDTVNGSSIQYLKEL